jgi:hypothetical protein
MFKPLVSNFVNVVIDAVCLANISPYQGAKRIMLSILPHEELEEVNHNDIVYLTHEELEGEVPHRDIVYPTNEDLEEKVHHHDIVYSTRGA